MFAERCLVANAAVATVARCSLSSSQLVHSGPQRLDKYIYFFTFGAFNSPEKFLYYALCCECVYAAGCVV